MANTLVEMLDGSGLLEFDEETGMVLEPQAKRDPEPGVDDEKLAAILKSGIEEAESYAEEDLASRRVLDQQYYDGEVMPGDENLDETRSRVISRDVRDTVKAILPSLLRTFFGGKSVVEFNPTGPEDEEWAQQATDYINDVVLQLDNNAVLTFYDAFHDALTKGLGCLMWYWEKNYEVTAHQYRGLTQAEYALVINDPRATDTNIVGQYLDEMGQELLDCDVTYRYENGGKIRVEAVPPEERLINSTARSIDDSWLYGRRRIVTVSDVVAMGLDYEQAIRLGGTENLDTNEEHAERLDNESYEPDSNAGDPSQRKLQFYDLYVKVDRDGDGFAEMYRILCGGTKYEILEYADGRQAIELANEIPMAELCPDPVPHLATGNSTSRSVRDIQSVKTNLLRAVLDSLSRSIFPDTEVVANQVNMDDVLSTDIGKVIRTRAPGMMREVPTAFMGKEGLPVLGYMDEVKVNRTGLTSVTQGLDPQALQSATPGAVSAAVGASQVQIEMIARLFAKGGMVRLFQGLLKMVKTHQDRARTVKLRGSWTPVDPRYWNANMQATVNTALGRGTEAERLSGLTLIASKQEAILEKLGPANPLVTMAQYHNTLAEMATLLGYPNPDKFFVPVSQQQVMQQTQQQMQQMQQQLMEAQQQLQGAMFELQNHTEAEDDQKRADAIKKRVEALDKLVNAIQTASGMMVHPSAAADEVAAGSRYLM